jgi:hypothetical protein
MASGDNEEFVSVTTFTHEEATGAPGERRGFGRDGKTECVSKGMASVDCRVVEERGRSMGPADRVTDDSRTTSTSVMLNSLRTLRHLKTGHNSSKSQRSVELRVVSCQ